MYTVKTSFLEELGVKSTLEVRGPWVEDRQVECGCPRDRGLLEPVRGCFVVSLSRARMASCMPSDIGFAMTCAVIGNA